MKIDAEVKEPSIMAAAKKPTPKPAAKPAPSPKAAPAKTTKGGKK
jgi:hypothetical protein